ncbi:hypothetical protein QFW77_04670 [Luteimonas sp. RD2P54]|uniref:Uncharacterized protein n=1 Tax=Luteimonas endophytica TaxID=3042023 RepID=A0ABT6J7X6_9GAMM|nr:hypothetical protein [Luteimonas endophytica]MDH5822283.1 hypothetical protein [Luteimonas endophytica]
MRARTAAGAALAAGIAAQSCALAATLDAHIRETDCHVPGNGTESATGYQLGKRSMTALQVRARRVPGPGFRLPGFNDALIGAGPLPLLEKRAGRRIAAGAGAGAR